MSLSFVQSIRNAALDAALEPAADNGYLNIYAGAVPANADASVGTATLLVALRMGSPAFGSASAGIKTANAITQAVTTTPGTATFFRLLKSDNTTVICQGLVAMSGSDINLASTVFQTADIITVTSFAVTDSA